MARRASTERAREPQEAGNKEKPHLEVIEGGKGKEKREQEPSWRQRAGEELKTMDVLAKEVRNLEKEILDAKSEEARAGLVEALEEIEGKLRETRSEWKQIIIDATFPEPSKDVEAALGEIRKMEAELKGESRESDTERALREIREMEAGPSVEVERIEREGAKPWETQETLMWEELRPGWEKDARTAAEDIKKKGAPEEKALAAEIIETNELPPRVERDLAHEAQKLGHEAERAMREVESLEARLDDAGVNTDKLATSNVARMKLGLRTLFNRKLRDLVRRYDGAVTRAVELDEDAKIAKLAEVDPARFSKVMNARIARTSALRARMEKRDAAFEKVMQQTGSAPRTG
ncbi:MAG: hypothetical protein AAB562_03270 [Patescibacteria group bacterium]